LAPWLVALMIAAPATVVSALLCGRSAILVFALYHVGICLLLPLVIDLRVRRWTWAQHLHHLGLLRDGALPGVGLGVVLAGVTALAAVAGLVAVRGWLPDDVAVRAVLAGWSVPPERTAGVLLFLALVNGPAEEFFWRGFVGAELRPLPCRWRRLLVPSVAYASYHGVTIPVLVPEPGIAALMTVAVIGAGLGWAWLRDRTGSVWPAVLSHGAAAAVYSLWTWSLLRP